jgi:ribose transport system substrate-binding protein
MRIAKSTVRAVLAATVCLGLSYGAAQAKDAKDVVIALVPKGAIPWFNDCYDGAKKEAAALGVQLQWVVPQNTQGSSQFKIIEELSSKKVDGIGISVNEPKSIESAIKEAMHDGIKFFTFDGDAPDSGRDMFIGTNNFAAGKVLGESMAKALDGKGEVAIVTGELGAVDLNSRIAGVKEALAAYPDIKIVATEGTEDNLAKAVSVDEALLRAHPDLKGMFGISQIGGPAIVKVLSEKQFASKKGELKVFAFDDLPDTIRGVKDGYIDGIMVQRPVTMCTMVVRHLVSQILGKEGHMADIDTGVTVVNAQNINNYTK